MQSAERKEQRAVEKGTARHLASRLVATHPPMLVRVLLALRSLRLWETLSLSLYCLSDVRAKKKEKTSRKSIRKVESTPVCLCYDFVKRLLDIIWYWLLLSAFPKAMNSRVTLSSQWPVSLLY